MMSPAHHVAEPDFRAAAVVFVSFLYAAAVHLVVHHAFYGEGIPIKTAFLVVLLVVFIFSDWCSRTRLPNLTRDRPSPLRFILKTLLEIVGVFFLVVSFLELLNPQKGVPCANVTRLSPVAAFGFFLIVTAAWDYLMLWVMQDLDLKHLAKASVLGTADSLKQLEPYLASYTAFVARREAEIGAQRTRDADQLTNPDGHYFDVVFHLLGGGLWQLLFRGIRGCVMQTLTNHVAYANLTAGGLILIVELGRGGVPLLNTDGFPSITFPYAFILNMATVFIITCVALLVVFGRKVGSLSAFAVLALSVGIVVVWFKPLAAFCLVAAPIMIFCVVLVAVFGAKRRGLRAANGRDASDAALSNAARSTQKAPPSGRGGALAAVPDGGAGGESAPPPWWRTAGAILLLACMVAVYATFAPMTVMIIMAVQQTLANVFLQATVVRPVSKTQSLSGNLPILV